MAMPAAELVRQQVEQYNIESYPYRDAVHNIASSMVNQAAKVQEGEDVLIWFDPPGMPLVNELYKECLAKGANVSFYQRDLDEDARQATILPLYPPEHDPEAPSVSTIHKREKELIASSQKMLLVRGAEHPEVEDKIPEDRKKIYKDGYWEAHAPRIDGSLEWWSLFVWPTDPDAALEKIPFEVCMAEMVEACNQPWEAIEKSQDKLIMKFNAAKRLTFVANMKDENPRRRTFVTMSLYDERNDVNMTFINSTIGKNYPGSEIFGAEILDSVNGQIFAEGRHRYDGKSMRDITLVIKDGMIVEGYAEEGQEELLKILGPEDSPNRRFGEVALGTNNKIFRQFLNPLLNEKHAGTAHMALGKNYTYTIYLLLNGEKREVNVNNGNNDADIHWDVAFNLTKDGMIILDGEVSVDEETGQPTIIGGEVVQINGIFVRPTGDGGYEPDPELDIISYKERAA